MPAAKPHTSPPLSPITYQGKLADRKTLVGLQHDMATLAHDPQIPAHIRAQCARTWRDLQETKRIIDGKPLPGQLRPDLVQVKASKKAKPLLLPTPDEGGQAEGSATSGSKESLPAPGAVGAGPGEGGTEDGGAV